MPPLRSGDSQKVPRLSTIQGDITVGPGATATEDMDALCCGSPLVIPPIRRCYTRV